MSLPENCCSTSLFTTVHKRLAEGRCRGLMGNFDWLLVRPPLTLLMAAVSPPEQVSALRTLYIGFRKAKLKKS
jgi:hypothetical protein